jgi:hypothetical protein
MGAHFAVTAHHLVIDAGQRTIARQQFGDGFGRVAHGRFAKYGHGTKQYAVRRAASRTGCAFPLARSGYSRRVVLRAGRRLDAGADDRTAGRGVGSVGAGIDGSGISTGSGADETGKTT